MWRLPRWTCWGRLSGTSRSLGRKHPIFASVLDVALNPHEEAYQKAKGVKEEEKAAAAWLKGVCSWLGSMPRLWHRRSYACIYRLSSCGIVYDLASKSAPTYISCHIDNLLSGISTEAKQQRPWRSGSKRIFQRPGPLGFCLRKLG